ncbi:alpha-N-acetylgalactosaminide alpha-2,6-sialyltransferase 2 [Brienomyrus brachyistius]|uniref:alpha-N-acetylgalactosaminide alpha-2,6-sialyltransferase 2 n=1 Tax=Brienomyrus brachyistius TaxID=42636 RepID=UPI0020B44E07|nr:alpha-N-acetylgalactosaminide alpha-2,6-sialyltransferase 2 [Brienomyrus brachyistius]
MRKIKVLVRRGRYSRRHVTFVCSVFLFGVTCLGLMASVYYGHYDPINLLSSVEDSIRGQFRRWSPAGYQNIHSRLNTALHEKEGCMACGGSRRKARSSPGAAAKPSQGAVTPAGTSGWPTCSLRWAAASGAGPAKQLNFSVSVLTTASDLRPSVFGRLRSHPLPYGWKDVPEETITEAVRLLNDTWSSRLFDRGSQTCVRCAVVGNSGILAGSGQGTAIDSHHFVFRVNGAVTEGFEKDVGTKTSFYGFSTNSMKNSLIAYYKDGFRKVPQGQDVHYVFIPAHSRDYLMLTAAIRGIPVTSGPDKGDHPSQYFGTNQGANHFKILSPEFIKYIKDEFLNSWQMISYPEVYIPSTGALMLMTALHMCDQVSAYGFITENYKDFSDHYYDAIKQPVELYANHDILMELKLWAALHAQKVMQLYQRPSNH